MQNVRRKMENVLGKLRWKHNSGQSWGDRVKARYFGKQSVEFQKEETKHSTTDILRSTNIESLTASPLKRQKVCTSKCHIVFLHIRTRVHTSLILIYQS